MAVTPGENYPGGLAELTRDLPRDKYLRRRTVPLIVLAALAFIAGLITGALRDSEAESTARVCDHGTGLGAPSTMDRKASSVPR